MRDHLLANLVLIIHFAFILFAVLGGFLVLRWRWAVVLHLPAVAWGVYIELSGNICPLTPLENRLRHRAGEAGYEGGFIEHYIMGVMYPDGLTHNVQLALAGTLVAINLLAYALVCRKSRAKRADNRLPSS